MRTMDQALIDYNTAVYERRHIVSRNASLRMRGRSDEQVPLPDLPPKTHEYQIVDEEGTYQGFTRAFTKDGAVKEFCEIMLENPTNYSSEQVDRVERGELPVGWRVKLWKA